MARPRATKGKRKKVDYVHTGPGTGAGQWLRRFWQPVHVGEELAAGWATRIRIMGEHFTLYRGAGGAAHLLADRCPHRKSQLSTGWIEGDELRCLYHGWKFGPDGACTEQPAEAENFKRKVCVRAYPVREYLGLIFAYLGPGAAPEFPEYPELEADNGYPLRARRTELRHNYFQRVENDMDEAHVHFVHKYSADVSGRFDVMPETFGAEETDYGILRLTVRRKGAKRILRHKHFFMPNITLTSPPPATATDIWSPHLGWRVPKDDDTTYSFTLSRTKPREAAVADKDYPPFLDVVDAILEGRMRLQDVDPYHPRLFFIQDSVAIEGQGRVHDAREDERLGRSDSGVILLRKIYAREIAALQAGRKIKRWVRPKERLLVGFAAAAE